MKLSIDGQAYNLANKNEIVLFLAGLFAAEYEKADDGMRLMAKPISRAVLLSMEQHARTRGETDPLIFRPKKGEDPNIVLLRMAIALAVGHSENANIQITTDDKERLATIFLTKQGEDTTAPRELSTPATGTR